MSTYIFSPHHFHFIGKSRRFAHRKPSTWLSRALKRFDWVEFLEEQLNCHRSSCATQRFVQSVSVRFTAALTKDTPIFTVFEIDVAPSVAR